MHEDLIRRIDEILEAKKISQHELAKKIGVTDVTVSRWLTGDRDPSIETLNRIAEALGTTTSAFFIKDNWKDKPKPAEEKESSVNWGSILAGTALTATAVIGIVALAKAMGKLNDKDKEQIESILNRE
ncbi:MAG: helix-turn-helix transcriptional regulator [Treponema sp.]|nr:helix-turn-helix transcriptional regulator [Treponema sp.]